MNSLLILESNAEVKPKGYDHVFSMDLDSGDSYADSYITPEEVIAIEDRTFDSLIRYIQENINSEEYSYRGVDLLRCFKKRILNLILFAECRYLILKRLIDSFGNSQIYIENCPTNMSQPFFRSIVAMSPLKGSERITVIPVLSDSFFKYRIAYVNRDNAIKRMWPNCIAWGKSRKPTIGIFSDPKKTHDIIRVVGPTNVVTYTDHKSPRLLLDSFRNGNALFQASISNNSMAKYKKIAGEYAKRLDEKNPFSDFTFSELQWDKILKLKTRELFLTELPKVLFDIDSTHDFIQTMNSIKSVLLDEDVAPTKNAFCQVMQQHRITSYIACHGVLGKKGGCQPLTADKIFVWGNVQKQKLEEWGCLQERIIVSGCSRYTLYKNLDSKLVKREICGRTKLDASKPIVLVGFMISRAFRRRLFERFRRKILGDVLELAKIDDKVQFIIKTKNVFDRNKAFCNDWIEKNNLNHRMVVVDNIDPLVLIKTSDLVIIHASTFGVDALALRKPVVSYYNQACRMFEEYRKHHAFYVADNREELVRIFQSIINGEAGYHPDLFKNARKECLNEGLKNPEEIISTHLVSVTPIKKVRSK